MIDPRQLSDRDILEHIDEESFRRGQAYATEGRIISPRRQGNTLKALCRGSIPEPYRLQATLDADGHVVAAECSCPVGYGGHCKHVAALLLTWRSDPERFVEVQDLATALEGKSKQELIRLLLTVAGVDPSIEQLLEITAAGAEAPPTSPDAAFYRDQVAATLGYPETRWEAWSGFGAGARLGGLLAQGEAMAAVGDWQGAAEAFRGILAGIVESGALGEDDEGGITEVTGACIAGLARCLDHLDDPAQREPIVTALFDFLAYDIIEFGGIGVSEEIPDILAHRTTPQERAALIERLREISDSEDEWTARTFSNLLIELETEELTGEEYLERARELGLTDRLVNRLLEQGRVDDATREAAEAAPDDLYGLVRVFDRHGRGDLLEPVIARHLAQGTLPRYFGVTTNLHDWLKRRYIERGDFAAALPIAREEFDAHPTIERYREVRDLAQATGRWDELRPELLDWLAERAPELQIEIYLEEGDLDAALRGVRELDLGSPFSGYRHGLRLRVAEAVEEERPEDALEIYLAIADELIEERGRENYAMAAALLARARDLFDQLDRFEDWEQHIARLRSDHRRLPALLEELDRAGV